MNRINWNEMWRSSEDAREKSENLEFWNSFAPVFRKKTDEPDPYIERFYEYMQADPEDTLFDMGCGSGTLAIPFAEKGHEIYAADFSPEMLKYLMKDAEEAGVADRIHPIQLNWNEDWTSRRLPAADIAFSSRSLIARDLTSSLKKLESVAKRKICMGVWDDPTADYDRHIAKAIGYERPGIGPHYMVMGELLDRDVFPELRFIRSPFRATKFADRQEAEVRIKKAFTAISEEQAAKLSDYLDEHLLYRNEKVKQHGTEYDGYWQFDHEETSTMAFISWEKKNIY